MSKNRLERLRTAKGWSKSELAEHLGVHPRTVDRWEKGSYQIPDPVKGRLCDLFGVSLDYLMGRTPEERS